MNESRHTFTGGLLKMRTQLDSPVRYQLPVGEHLVPLNPLLGSVLRLSFSGEIYDIHDGTKIKKSYGQGYSYQNFMRLACCDSCIIRPHECHYHQGTCREPQWGEEHCFKPHCVYLANTSGLKVGITRQTQIPTRWIDQGAAFALPILKVPDRKTAGVVEVEISRHVNDKTDWRKMLRGETGAVDLVQVREDLFSELADFLDDCGAEDVGDDVIEITYPVREWPVKITPLSFEKTPVIEGKLVGIKGQYLILDTGVLNIRKYQGYRVELTVESREQGRSGRFFGSFLFQRPWPLTWPLCLLWSGKLLRPICKTCAA